MSDKLLLHILIVGYRNLYLPDPLTPLSLPLSFFFYTFLPLLYSPPFHSPFTPLHQPFHTSPLSLHFP